MVELLHKKKQLESVRPVAFKSISPVAVKEKNIAEPDSRTDISANRNTC